MGDRGAGSTAAAAAGQGKQGHRSSSGGSGGGRRRRSSSSKGKRGSDGKEAPLTSARYLPPQYEVPMEGENKEFTKSFALDDGDGIREFFAEFGFVVVRDVVGAEQCANTITDIWRLVMANAFRWSQDAVPKRGDEATWSARWPASHTEGIVMNGNRPVWSRPAVEIRQHPGVYKVFSQVYGVDELLVNNDRYGIFRPTRAGIGNEGEIKQDHLGWRTERNLHLDMNPWLFQEESDPEMARQRLEALDYTHLGDFYTENNDPGFGQINLQGLVNLANNRAEDGGFHLVPGFRKHLAEFCYHTPDLRRRFGPYNRFIMMPPSTKIHRTPECGTRICMRAGSVLVWDQMTLHGSAPNASPNFRYAAFLKYFPASSVGPLRQAHRRTAVGIGLDAAGSLDALTPLGRRLHGLDPWPSSKAAA